MTPQTEPVPENFLPRSIGGRFLLFVLSIVAIPFGGTFFVILLIGHVTAPAGMTWGEWFVRLAAEEFCATLFVTGCVGVTWAVATPSWLPDMAFQVGKKMVLWMLVPWIASIWMLAQLVQRLLAH